ncbi:MAG: hypothetical protein GY951_00015 [Psychromonas sp.]|nr:hypothetical protein [Psychromonas sp.]
MKSAQILAVGCIFLLVAGCSGEAEDMTAATNSFEKQCKGNITAELHLGAFNRWIDIKCDNFTSIDSDN